MNPIKKEIKIGTIGEILVQLRLLQYSVQSAPALKDSGRMEKRQEDAPKNYN